MNAMACGLAAVMFLLLATPLSAAVLKGPSVGLPNAIVSSLTIVSAGVRRPAAAAA